jgi:ribonuclease VapC
LRNAVRKRGGSLKLDCVLDASAVLALLHRERGAEVVRKALEHAALSAVNAAEVAAKLVRLGESEPDARADVAALGVEIVPFDGELAFLSASAGLTAPEHGFSLGDRACLATAQKLGVPAVTADRNWRVPGLGVSVRFIR